MRMKSLILAAALLAAAVPATAAETLKQVVGSYLEIQAALAADKLDGVAPAARRIATDAAALAGGDAIVKAARVVESAADVKAARAAFGDLSDAVIAAAKEDPAAMADVKVAYCPMAKKSWLQKGDKISNPYYGSSMLTCGEFKK